MTTVSLHALDRDEGARASTASDVRATESAGPSTRVSGLSLAVLLLGTTILYLWNLSANGWANSFYTAAIQAGSQS